MKMINVNINILPHGMHVPQRMTPMSSGYDLCACIDDKISLKFNEIKLIPTGICIQLPDGSEAQVRPRSGLALRHGVTVLNAPGTIDADYTGEIQVILINHGKKTFYIERGMRIAQMVFQNVLNARWRIVDELNNTSRNGGGFGHTGL